LTLHAFAALSEPVSLPPLSKAPPPSNLLAASVNLNLRKKKGWAVVARSTFQLREISQSYAFNNIDSLWRQLSLLAH